MWLLKELRLSGYHRKNQDSLAKWLIPGPRLEICQMNLESFAIPDRKEAIEGYKGHIKRNKKII